MKTLKEENQALYSIMMMQELDELAHKKIRTFVEQVKPTVQILGLLTDDNIRKYLKCTDMSSIYRDAQEKQPQRLAMMQDFAEARGEDFFKDMRDPGSPARTPGEDGFQFRKLFLSDIPEQKREKVIKAIKVTSGILSVDRHVIDEESIVTPTPRMCELYDLAADFCQKVNSLNIKRKGILSWLLCYDKDGRSIKPNANGIVWGERMSGH